MLTVIGGGISACGYEVPKFDLLTSALDQDPVTEKAAEVPGQKTPSPGIMQSSILLNPPMKEDLLKLSSGSEVNPNDDEYASLWDRMRNNFRIEYPLNKRVDSQLRGYAMSQSYMNQIGERGGKYLYYIVEEAEKRDMPAEVALLPAIESSFQPFIKSAHAAAGIWQIIPGTGQTLGLKRTSAFDGHKDIVTSTNAALDYLDRLHTAFDGDWLLALAAYNSGEGTISRAVEKNRRRGKPIDFWSLDLSRETKEFVPRFLALTRLIQNPDAFNLSLPDIPNEPYFASVEVDQPMNLKQVAKLVNVDMGEMKMLNPGVNQPGLIQKSSFEFHVPAEKEQLLQYKLIALTPEQEKTWGRHRVNKGESMRSIAAQYDTKVAVLKKANPTLSNPVKPGEMVKVPMTEIASVAKPFEPVVSESKKDQTAYRVKSGDTLWSVARKFKVDILDLQKWNKDLSQRKALKAGQVLDVYVKNNDEDPF